MLTQEPPSTWRFWLIATQWTSHADQQTKKTQKFARFFYNHLRNQKKSDLQPLLLSTPKTSLNGHRTASGHRTSSRCLGRPDGARPDACWTSFAHRPGNCGQRRAVRSGCGHGGRKHRQHRIGALVSFVFFCFFKCFFLFVFFLVLYSFSFLVVVSCSLFLFFAKFKHLFAEKYEEQMGTIH